MCSLIGLRDNTDHQRQSYVPPPRSRTTSSLTLYKPLASQAHPNNMLPSNNSLQPSFFPSCQPVLVELDSSQLGIFQFSTLTTYTTDFIRQLHISASNMRRRCFLMRNGGMNFDVYVRSCSRNGLLNGKASSHKPTFLVLPTLERRNSKWLLNSQPSTLLLHTMLPRTTYLNRALLISKPRIAFPNQSTRINGGASSSSRLEISSDPEHQRNIAIFLRGDASKPPV